MILKYQFSLIKFGYVDNMMYICIGNLREN